MKKIFWIFLILLFNFTVFGEEIDFETSVLNKIKVFVTDAMEYHRPKCEYLKASTGVRSIEDSCILLPKKYLNLIVIHILFT